MNKMFYLIAASGVIIAFWNSVQADGAEYVSQ